jgi:NitT/TauT family transport system permease protein
MRLINQQPSRIARYALGALPFAIVLLVYSVASKLRHMENPQDRLLPSLTQMAEAVERMAFTPSKRTGEYTMWLDTLASLERIGVGMLVSTVLALLLGIAIGAIPRIRATLAPFVGAFSLIPPITVLPILFIVFGLGETAKIALIVVGTAPVMIRTVAQATADVPDELLVKVQTLGANSWQIVTRVFLPMVLPRLIGAIRMGLVPAWIFLVSAEAIAAEQGLGYRIFLVRRYLAMDVILPYVAWITIIAYAVDRALYLLSRKGLRWAHGQGGAL